MTLKLLGRRFESFQGALARQAKAWRLGGGSAVEARFVEVEDLYRELTAGDAKASRRDVVMVATDWFPTLIATGRLLCLDPYLHARPPADWPEDWAPSLRLLQCDAGGRCYGAPYHDGPEMLMYRRDLFEDEDERRRYLEVHGRPLVPPATWTEFRDVARFFTRTGRQLYGTVLATFPDAHNIIYDFLLQLWSRGGEVLGADGFPSFHEPAGVQGLRFLRELLHEARVTPPDCSTVDSVEAGQRFAAGQVAMMVNWAGFAALAQSGPSSRVRGAVGWAPPPGLAAGGGCSLNVYWCLAIPADAVHPDEAWEFIRWCGSANMDRVTTEAGAIGVRRSTWRDPSFAGGHGFEVFDRLHAIARHLPRTPAWGPMSEVLNGQLDAALNRGADPQTALCSAARECTQILRAEGGLPGEGPRPGGE